MTRKAFITSTDVERIARFLPSNYRVLGIIGGRTIIVGEDSAGWTLDDYVLPRLASGLLFGKEMT
jgi:hypothetical protein